MKYQVTQKADPNFIPVTVTLTFETQQELDAARTVFGDCDIRTALNKAKLPDPFPSQLSIDLDAVGAVFHEINFLK